MNAKIQFVKGHCGWDVVTLVPEGQVAPGSELDASIKMLSSPLDGGLEVGWLGQGQRRNEITLRMVSATTRNWIAMCGGMSQVIGKALVETHFRDVFNIVPSDGVLTVVLVTPSGEIPLRIDVRDRSVQRITTVMDNYVEHVYRKGVERLRIENFVLWKAGSYALMDLVELEDHYPDVDFTRRDPGPHLDIVNRILRGFASQVGVAGVPALLYDSRPEGPGHFRVFPRFYSEDQVAARIPWEFQCGTGGIAVAVALAREGRLPSAKQGEVLLEWGSYRTTPDPYGIRTTQLNLETLDTRVTRASFSHSVVEILAEGTLHLPGY